MQEILKNTPEVTAVFAMADVIAIGAIRAACDAGKRVPEDISVIGYDGLKVGDYYCRSCPPLRSRWTVSRCAALRL